MLMRLFLCRACIATRQENRLQPVHSSTFISWFEFLEENKDVSSFTVDVNRPYSMGQARRIVKENGEKIVNFNLMNIFEIQQFTLKACGDSSKRRYDENNKPETFNDLLHNCYDLKSWDSFHEIDYILSGGK